MQLSRASHLIAPLLILALFAPALIGVERLAFRDVSHFYTPLYDYVAARTSDQWLPLWNPLDQTGLPLLGETTTAVLYPIRYLLFALPITTETAVAWYIVLHLILASITANQAARWAGIGPTISSLVGIVYSLSGSVLFLYTNPPFLVGAAWLPLVLGVMFSRQRLATKTRVLIAAPAMSMILLGGDPQTALHAMIVAGVFYLAQLIRSKERSLTLVSLTAVPVIAALLAAPQLCASISWSRQSDRVGLAETNGWIEPPTPGSMRFESFQYSVAPWHAAELVTPNAFGSLYPVFRRVAQLIPGDGRMWTPSLYMGMLVVVGIGLAFADRRLWSTDRWKLVAVASFILALGHFGLAMVVQSSSGTWSQIDSAAGGPYWLVYHFLPGYDSFRYPAKWLPLFSLGLAVAIGDVFDRYQWKPIRWRWFVFTGIVSILGVGFLTILRVNSDWVTDRVDPWPQDEFWGPLNLDGGLAQIQFSILHSALATSAMLGLTRIRCQMSKKVLALLVIVALDLSIAGRGMIAMVPVQREQALITAVSPQELKGGSRWMRTQAGDGWPEVWKQTSDSDRMLDVEASLRISRIGRWHLADRVGMLNNMVSIQSKEIAEFWLATKEVTAEMSASQRKEFWQGIRRWLAIDGVIHQPTSVATTRDGNRVAQLIDARQVWKPKAGWLRFVANANEQTVAQQSDINFAERLKAIAGQTLGQTITAGVAIEAERAIYSGIELDQSGMLVRPVFQDGHWRSEYAPAGSNQWQSAAVLKVDRLTQGLILPAGNWDVRFSYQPTWLLPSLVVAASAWIGLLIWWRSESALRNRLIRNSAAKR